MREERGGGEGRYGCSPVNLITVLGEAKKRKIDKSRSLIRLDSL